METQHLSTIRLFVDYAAVFLVGNLMGIHIERGGLIKNKNRLLFENILSVGCAVALLEILLNKSIYLSELLLPIAGSLSICLGIEKTSPLLMDIQQRIERNMQIFIEWKNSSSK